jgi:predicted acyl esterase
MTESGVRTSVTFIRSFDGTPLAATLYLPAVDRHAGPYATLVEALPYRMHDVTASYDDSYLRYADEGGFAVLRLDLRGTGSSGGIIDDEYTDTERRDLRAVIGWIARQPWSTGRVGMFGTSYSGFNSLHMACDGVAELGAIVAIYATDDRATDDVHLCGGIVRALDLIDYPLYMVAMNALPPVPSMWDAEHGEGDWRRQWRRRIDETPPWLLRWLHDPHDSPTWRRGSVRLGPNGEGYERITCPTMVIAGWADGYRNNTFRTVAELDRNGTPWRLLAGPWSHKDPSTARPGPNVDADREIIAFFDQHLRGGPASAARPAQVFVRHPVAARHDLALHPGEWIEFDAWPPKGWHVEQHRPGAGHGTATLAVEGDVGTAAWNSCAGGLPWGQPLDQRNDDARSITVELDHRTERTLIGHPVVRFAATSSATVGQVSVKLCDVAPDGRSTLVTRGMLDLRLVGCWPADSSGTPGTPRRPLVPGEPIEVTVELEACAWLLRPGHRLRVSIAGTDWPNSWPAAASWTLGVDLDSLVVDLPVSAQLEPCRHEFIAGPGPSSGDDGVVWRTEHDVIEREARIETRYGGPYDGRDGIAVVDEYVGSLGIDLDEPSRGWARGHARFELTVPLAAGTTAVCRTESNLSVRSDETAFHVTMELRAHDDDTEIAHRTWTTTIPR